MYKTFKATNFRCFRDLAIEDLQRINLIAGLNNVGKTTLLEALFLHSGAYKPGLTLTLDSLRGVEAQKIEIKFERGRWGANSWIRSSTNLTFLKR